MKSGAVRQAFGGAEGNYLDISDPFSVSLSYQKLLIIVAFLQFSFSFT